MLFQIRGIIEQRPPDGRTTNDSTRFIFESQHLCECDTKHTLIYRPLIPRSHSSYIATVLSIARFIAPPVGKSSLYEALKILHDRALN